MHDRDDQDAVRFDLVENPVWEAMDQTTSNIVLQYAESLGIRHDARQGRLDVAAEIAAQAPRLRADERGYGRTKGDTSNCLPSIIRQYWVAVGTPVTRRPPHGSVREALPHTALTSGC